MAYVHRVSYEIFRGAIPEDKCVLHRCGHKLCINPEHLYLGNAKDNWADARKDGTAPIGSQHGMSKLTEAKVVLMRKAHAEQQMPIRSIAELFGVTYGQAWNIVKRRNWKHVP